MLRHGSADAGRARRAEIEAAVAPSATLSPAERIDIYAAMYAFRLQEALAKDFPAVVHALGGEMWDRVSRDYVRDVPSRSYNLNDYSAGFPKYLARRRDLRHSRFLGELAELEWAMVRVVHAPAAAPLDVKPLEGLAPERWMGVRFVAAPTLVLLAFRFPINDYYQRFRDGKRPAIPTARRSWVAVQRKDFVVWRVTLSHGMFVLLSSLARGASLADAIRATLRARAIGAAELERVAFLWFREWVGDGFFARAIPPAARARIRAEGLFAAAKGKRRRAEHFETRRFATRASIPNQSEGAIGGAGAHPNKNGGAGATGRRSGPSPRAQR